MTKNELWQVRTLNLQIRDTENHIKLLRQRAGLDAVHLDGMPHATPLESKFERIVLEIVESTANLSQMREQLLTLASRLTSELCQRITEPNIRAVMLMRYVSCMSFDAITTTLHMSKRTVFNLHKKGILHLRVPPAA